MSNGFDYSKLTGMKLLFAKLADKDRNGFLDKTEDYDEISVFNKMNDSYEEGLGDKKSEISIFKDNEEVYFQNFIDRKPEVKDIKNSREYLKEEQLKLISLKVQQEAMKKQINLSKADLDYWADKIFSISDEYNIQPTLLVAVIAKETNGSFRRNLNSSTGSGPMQVTTITIQDFFPNAKGSWNSVYKNLDNDLLNSILYKKDENGDFIKDEQGNFVLNKLSPKALRDECSKNDKLGIEVGLLCLKMKYAKAVAEIKFGRANYKTVPQTIDKLKSGEIQLTELENQRAIEIALKNYNSVFDSYATEVIDTLKTSGFDFKDVKLIEPIK